MRDLVTGEVFPIGTPGQGRMEPIPEALDGHAAAILRKIPDGSDVMIDEVGYLESSCARYAKELERLFDRCTVIAALRKDHTPLLDRLRSRPDVFVWDLDLHQHPCQVGCVVMASGWSRRFSGENKLLLPLRGRPLILSTIGTALEFTDDVVVVTGHERERLEAVLKREIQDLGYEITEVEDGRVTFKGDIAAVCRANLFLRTAERVLLKAGSFRAESFE